MSGSFGNAMFFDERQFLGQFSPLSLPSVTSGMMSSTSFNMLPSMSHSTPVAMVSRPQPILPGHLSPLNYSKLSPLASKSVTNGSFSPLSLSYASPESAFSPVEKSSSSSTDSSKSSPLSQSYSPFNHSVATPPAGYLNRLRSNPMFQDLQLLLAQECRHLQVPASLITSQWNLDNLQTSMSPSTSPSSTETARDHATSSSQQVYALHMQLQDRFLRLHGDKDLNEYSRKMESLYCSEVGRIEMQRYQSLCSSYTEQSKYTVNIHYNRERITNVERFQKEVDVITKQPVIKQPSTSTPVASRLSKPESPASTSTDSMNEFYSLPRTADAPSYTSSASTSEESSSSLMSTTSSPEATTEESTPETSAPRSRTGRLLSAETIKMMTQWYEAHMTYPYPSDEDVSQLASAGGITHGQVRKWLANKRVRSFNTLSITGNDHPIKYKYRGKGSEGTMEASVNRRPQYKLLSSAAKQILTDWYDQHSENPYPTEEEKEDLAEKARVSSAQVKSWFANKRSRTNNTKRQVPNYFIKKFPGYTPIVEMVSEQRAARKVSSKAVERVRVDLYQPFNM